MLLGMHVVRFGTLSKATPKVTPQRFLWSILNPGSFEKCCGVCVWSVVGSCQTTVRSTVVPTASVRKQVFGSPVRCFNGENLYGCWQTSNKSNWFHWQKAMGTVHAVRKNIWMDKHHSAKNLPKALRSVYSVVYWVLCTVLSTPCCVQCTVSTCTVLLYCG